MNYSDIYLRFLNLTHAMREDLISYEIDLIALRLLEMIAINHANKAPLTVTQAMAFNLIASPATLHRKLIHLIEAGLIEQSFAEKNRRTKYLIPTKITADYFERLGNALALSLKPQK